MAHLFVCAVFDVQSQAFARPLFVAAKGVAVRMVADEVNRAAADNLMYQHPEDFRLFELGSWDENTGLFAAAQPLLIVDCVSLRGDGGVPRGAVTL